MTKNGGDERPLRGRGAERPPRSSTPTEATFSRCGRAGARCHPAGGRTRPSRAPTSAAQRKIVSRGRTQLRVSCTRSLPQHGRMTSRSAPLGGTSKRGIACTVVPHALRRRRARCGLGGPSLSNNFSSCSHRRFDFDISINSSLASWVSASMERMLKKSHRASLARAPPY